MARHASLADQLSALMAYRNRPEGEPESVKTNWTTVPANDNADPEETIDFSFERNLLVTPSVQEILRQIKTKDVERNDAGQIIRIGKLRFSDGTQTERAYTQGPDGDVIQMDARMPVGAMLGTTEKAKEQSGGKGYTQAQLEQSNLFFAAMLDTIEPRYIKRTKRRNGPSLTADESRVVLAKAIANTPKMPKVRRYKPGLPCGGQRIADSFIGMQKGKKGESGAIAWEDIATHKVNREIWDEALARLADEDKTVLDAALVARTYEEVGIAAGQSRLYARDNGGGKRALKAANDNLAIILKETAA
jgi:hypothetical protein